jgi:hypothetical protein
MSDTVIVPDCLVLKIVERNCATYERDTVLYIFYDIRTMYYSIRGKRHDGRHDGRDFSFITNDTTALIEFITQVIDVTNLWTYVLYDMENLPSEANEITYEMLSEYASSYRELAGYNNLKYKRRSLLNMLNMLKRIINYY